MTHSLFRFQDNYLGCEPDQPLPKEFESLDLALTCVVLVIPVATLIIGNATLLIMAWIIGKFYSYILCMVYTV